MFRSALVALKPERAQALISYALDLAKTYQWELGGLSVVDRDRIVHHEPIPIGGTAYAVDRDQRHLESANQLALTVTHELQDACRLANVRCDAKVSQGDTVGEIMRATLGFDVLLCGHTPGSDASERSLLHSLIKHNARPAIVIPRDPVSGPNVLLGYDGSLQAGRAMSALAYSGLLANRHLHVVCLHADYAGAATVTSSAMSFLSRHGIQATCHPEILVRHPADQLIDAAKRLDVGLFAMGAFGKSALREFFFGSVTQTLLEKLNLPILLDH